MAPTIRPLTAADDLAGFGRIVLASYEGLVGHPADPTYDAEILDVAGRVERAVVLGALDGDTPLGCVTYVPDAANPFAEDLADDEASFRMLGVAAAAQGRGVGAALVETCLDAAGAAGRRAVFIHSGSWMTAAHRLYGRLGFRRAPDRDWVVPEVGVSLLGFERDVSRRARARPLGR
jgi:ribosomal protein S18 acetylase RimI-like enzyme